MIFDYIYNALLYAFSFGAMIVLVFSLVLILIWVPRAALRAVLEGELYFETAAGTSRVTAGEVMAIPAEVDHAVYTKEVAARAVDAWSPINEKYHAAR